MAWGSPVLKIVCFVWLASFALLVAGTGASAQERVTVRAFAGPTFSRIAFDWPAPVQYQTRSAGAALVIEFARPLNADLSNLPTALRGTVLGAALGADGRTITIALREAYNVRTTVADSTVIFDIATVARGAAPPAAAPPPAVAAPVGQTAAIPPASGPTTAVRVRGGEHPDYTRVVFDWPAAVGYTAEQSGNVVTLQFDRAATFEVAQRLGGGGFPYVEGIRATAVGNASTVEIRTAAGSGFRHNRSGQSVVVDVLAGGDAQRPPATGPAVARTDAAARPAPAPVPATPPPVRTGPDPGNLTVSFVRAEGGFAVSLEWQALVAAAVYERAGFHWIVFDHRGEVEIFPREPGLDELLLSIEPLPFREGTAIRLKVKQGLFPEVSRRNASWRVDFRPRNDGPREPVTARREIDGAGHARVILNAPDTGKRLAIADPEVGDTLTVVPLLDPGRGVAAERTFAEFKLLASAQGVAVDPRADSVQVKPLRGAVEIGAAEGLALSEEDAKSEAPSTAEPAQPAARPGIDTLLRYREW